MLETPFAKNYDCMDSQPPENQMSTARENPMKPLNYDAVRPFLSAGLVALDRQQIELLRSLSFASLFTINPYVAAKPSLAVGKIVMGRLDTILAMHEQILFSDLLVELAIFVASETLDGDRSDVPGSNLKLTHSDITYLISIEPYWSWHVNSQDRIPKYPNQTLTLANLANQDTRLLHGICYGKAKTDLEQGILVGADFWRFVSGDHLLYTDIIQPLAERVKLRSAAFTQEYARVVNRFTRQFIERFCDETGAIDWVKLVEFNSGNYDLDRFPPA